MSAAAVTVQGLGKQYTLGAAAPEGHLRERLAGSVLGLARRLGGRGVPRAVAPTIWALRDVSFEVASGEVVGIIGGNGAGKSTLLKILSRITSPTEGRAEIRGRVGSLLEVGTGFHPELTGRENVFLNGAILGMGRAEIHRKFDAIVDFAEVERFIDTPVKYYSSGMYVRLAFAVAAHLEPEILIVDEVLAVGDAKFQKKCLGKIGEVAQGGRTVLFVSHNMAAVQRLCTTAALLEKGRLVFRGEPRAAVARYLSDEGRVRYIAASAKTEPYVAEAELVDAQGGPLPRPVITEPIGLRATIHLPDAAPGTRFGIGVLMADGIPLFTSSLDDVGLTLPAGPGTITVTAVVPAHTLLAGDYHVVTCLWHAREIVDLQEPAFSFSAATGDSALYRIDAERKGAVHVNCRWEIA
ncbi:MAG: polysaccharide ABC transporter ATP-binding protein [Vicinamibacterales bacterium]|nr:polysaccharide ABC transporter ATP-binding protein [Vicinamibacterales bacterium]